MRPQLHTLSIWLIYEVALRQSLAVYAEDVMDKEEQ